MEHPEKNSSRPLIDLHRELPGGQEDAANPSTSVSRLIRTTHPTS
jgi:hypothetical protein